MNISVLLTCHNRRAKTGACLKSLKTAWEAYNNAGGERVNLVIFLTDDGCTDGTVETAREVFPEEEVLHILPGDGNLYWAGGMRFSWLEAMKRHNEWDYYLLLNDDTTLMDNLFFELFATKRWVEQHYKKQGLISGNTCTSSDSTKRSYGGRVWKNKFLATTTYLNPNGEPQHCDLTNANILLVPSSVVDTIGIFYAGYYHGYADYDYSLLANRRRIPVVVTARFCGVCDFDHSNRGSLAAKIISMSLQERKTFFQHPLHSSHDSLTFARRNMPIRYPISLLGSLLNLYFPRLYYRIDSMR